MTTTTAPRKAAKVHREPPPAQPAELRGLPLLLVQALAAATQPLHAIEAASIVATLIHGDRFRAQSMRPTVSRCLQRLEADGWCSRLTPRGGFAATDRARAATSARNSQA
ncbi:MAG: hypothetical protein U0575_07405 [Phycisphaerales bacterium]